MNYGVQLGRRFRSLKLWFIIRYFGVEGITERIRDNLRLGQKVKTWVESKEDFALMAPVPFSTVCFRVEPKSIPEEKLNEFNEQLMHHINSTGKVFLSHTVLKGKFVIRVVVSSFRTLEEHVDLTLKTIEECYEEIKP